MLTYNDFPSVLKLNLIVNWLIVKSSITSTSSRTSIENSSLMISRTFKVCNRNSTIFKVNVSPARFIVITVVITEWLKANRTGS